MGNCAGIKHQKTSENQSSECRKAGNMQILACQERHNINERKVKNAPILILHINPLYKKRILLSSA